MYKKYDPAIADRKRKNAHIFYETTRCIKAGSYTAPSGRTVPLDMSEMISGAVCYQKEIPAVDAPAVDGGTTVMVEGNDCLKAAERLVAEGYRPALLNFASAGHPGGGVETGARAQEETICRRSTLTRSIYSFHPYYAGKYGYPLAAGGTGYPITGRHSVVYSPAVTVFREGLECTMMENPYQVAVLTCAALNLGGRYEIRLTPDGHMPKEAIDITLSKIRAVFRAALVHGHDSLVLGAFGCGAFRNPPREMAALFHQVMEEPEFKDRLRLITFSIINDHNTIGSNLAAFMDEFCPEKA
jgi:uncharacterized protein (TIGR02452 family)